jgi:hypothetical protein
MDVKLFSLLNDPSVRSVPEWTREGAHYVLQIRAMIASGDWERNCQGAVLAGLKATA